MAVTRILAPVFLVNDGHVVFLPEMELAIDHELEMQVFRRDTARYEFEQKTSEIIQAMYHRRSLSPKALSQLSFFDLEELRWI